VHGILNAAIAQDIKVDQDLTGNGDVHVVEDDGAANNDASLKVMAEDMDAVEGNGVANNDATLNHRLQQTSEGQRPHENCQHSLADSGQSGCSKIRHRCLPCRSAPQHTAPCA